MTEEELRARASQIRAVIFDKDGTLFEFESTWTRYCDQMFDALVGGDEDKRACLAAACGYDHRAKTFVAGSLIVGGSIEEICSLWAGLLELDDNESVLALSRRIVTELEPEPLADLPQLTQDLAAMGLTLGVVTNDLEAAARQQLKQADIAHCFALVLGSDSGYTPKPAADTLQAFCQHTGIEPQHVAMVGDSIHDLKAAEHLGAGLAIAVLTGPATEDSLSPCADVVIADVGHLPHLLSGGAVPQ